MSFLDILVEVKAKNAELPIRGNAGLFRITFGDEGKRYRVLKVHQIIGRSGSKHVKDVKYFKYNPKTRKLFVETKLSYFGSVNFLVKYIEMD